MSNINMANRQVADVDIRDYKTKKPIIHVETANTTTAGLTSDNVYAMAKGTRRIAFNNPLEGTMSIELQVYPFQLFSLFSDGVIENKGVYATSAVITATVDGSLTFSSPPRILDNSVFVYPEDSYMDDTALISGTFTNAYSSQHASGPATFVATNENDIVEGQKYKVAFIANEYPNELGAGSNAYRVSFNNKRLPSDYFITMRTLDKTEDGLYTPFLLTAYKATIQRNFELSFSSEGDPASITLNFDLCEDSDGNVLDMVELEDND